MDAGPNPEEPDAEACRGEVRRVIESSTFAKAPRLILLLQYLCERSIDRQFDELSEQQIGIHFFQRIPGYNAGEDTIVRGTARHLRQRLERYYEEEGRNSPLRITIPKGAYVVRFESAGEQSAQADDLSRCEEPSLSTSRRSLLFLVPWTLAVVGIIAVSICVWTYFHWQDGYEETAGHGPAVLWRSLFVPGRKTIIVPGDAALNLYTAYLQKDVALSEYTEQTYQNDPNIQAHSPYGTGSLSRLTITPMADLRLVSELVQVPYWMKRRKSVAKVEVRYARDLLATDVYDNNLILIGTDYFNPWVRLYEPSLDFRLTRDLPKYTFLVTNRAPKPGEQAQYTWDGTRSVNGALTIVALVQNSQGAGGKVLLVQGTTMGSTDGALNFLFTDSLWRPVIAAATGKDGVRDFEVLLSSDFVRDGVSNTHVVAFHVH